MKTSLNLIKNTYAQEQGYEDWRELQEYHSRNPREIESYMNEICIRAQKEALEWAARRSGVINDETTDFIWEVDRSTITNPENLIR